MSILESTALESIAQERITRGEMAPIAETDVIEVASFIADQSGRSTQKVASHLRWFLLENPARRAQDPLGFGLRSSSKLVGCILCSPQTFCFQNEIIPMMGSSMFYVDELHRGYGGRIFLQYCRLANRWPLFGTSANAEAAALWKAAGANPLPYADAELFGILRWAPVAEEFVHRKSSNRLLSQLVASPLTDRVGRFRSLKIDCGLSVALQRLSSAEQVNELIVPYRSKKLTALREPSYIRWRYFSGMDPSVAVFAFRAKQPDSEILVAVNQRTRGYRCQINTLNVLDVHPEVCPAEWVRIVEALIGHYNNAVDAVVLRSQDPERRKIFCARGFQQRDFDAPNGWFLDKGSRLPTCDWYPVPADGDGLI